MAPVFSPKGWESSARGTAPGTQAEGSSLKGWDSARLSQPFRLPGVSPSSRGGAPG